VEPVIMPVLPLRRFRSRADTAQRSSGSPERLLPLRWRPDDLERRIQIRLEAVEMDIEQL
jgi:hypothetical protein